MKTLKYIIICGAALGVTLSSCKKSFLDEAPNDNTISTEQEAAAVAKDPSLVSARVAGLYTTMYQDFTGGSGNNDHDDFGQKGYDIFSDMLCSDMVLGGNNYGWYESLVRYQATQNAGSTEDYIPFRYYYKIIFAANSVVAVSGGNDANPTNADLKHYLGQAKAMRAYAYFYLTNFYCPTGYGAGTEKILPLITDINQLNQPAVATSVVYDQMIKDLTDAISLLSDFTRANKGQIDADVAKGLLAYVYEARGAATNNNAADLNKVITLTDEILAKYPLTTASEAVGQFDFTTGHHEGKVLNPESGFNNLATPSWMWGADLTLDIGLDLVSWWGQMDIYTYSYAWAGDPKFIDEDLYNAIHADDIRKNQFFNNAQPYDNDYHFNYDGLLPQGKFFNAGRLEGGQRNVTDDYIYMRADEMVLLNAEAKARLGQDANARTELKVLLAQRFPTAAGYAYVDALAGDPLKNEIYLQTRIELWGEGKSYLSMKRNQYEIKRGPNHLFLAGQTFQAKDPKLTFVVPSAEFLYNPNLNK